MAQLLASGAILRRTGDWLSAKVGDESVMMSVATGRYLGLSDTASAIWDLLETPRSLAALCELLSDQYEISPEDAYPDVTAFVREMIYNGAIAIEGEQEK